MADETTGVTVTVMDPEKTPREVEAYDEWAIYVQATDEKDGRRYWEYVDSRDTLVGAQDFCEQHDGEHKFAHIHIPAETTMP